MTRSDAMRKSLPLLLLAALSLAHVFVFGWRVMDLGKKSLDSFGYIEVARNLSAEKGFLQSSPGFHQPSFWGEDFNPDFPPKVQSSHNLAYPLAIFAVAETAGIDHPDAAFLIGALSYAAAFALSFALGLRLWGLGAGFLSASAIIWLNGRSLFWHAWTEPFAVALLLGALFLLASRPNGASFAAAGVLSGFAFIQRAAMLPLMAVGFFAAAMQKEKKARRVALFALGASIGVIRFVLHGKSEQKLYPLRSIDEIFGVLSRETLLLLWEMGPLFAVLAALGVVLRRRQIAETRASQAGTPRFIFARGEMTLLGWALGYSAFLLAVFSAADSESFASSRIIYPAKIAALILCIGLLWRILPTGRGRMIFAAGVFALSLAYNIARDAKALAMRDGSDAAAIASSDLLRWADANVSSNDLVIGENVIDFPHYFDRIDSVISYSPRAFHLVNEEKITAIVRRRCGRYGDFYLIVARNSRERIYGPYLNRLVAGEPVDGAVRVADLRDGLVYRLTICDSDYKERD